MVDATQGSTGHAHRSASDPIASETSPYQFGASAMGCAVDFNTNVVIFFKNTESFNRIIISPQDRNKVRFAFGLQPSPKALVGSLYIRTFV
jgi:hypothetical protein